MEQEFLRELIDQDDEDTAGEEMEDVEQEDGDEPKTENTEDDMPTEEEE